MTTPITGPFVYSSSSKGPPDQSGKSTDWKAIVRTSYRQKKPYTLPLPYAMDSYETVFGLSLPNFASSYGYATGYRPDITADKQRLYNATYAKFIAKVKEDAAELASTIATWKQSEQMIVERASQLVRGIKAVRRGDVRALRNLWGKDAGIRPRLRRVGSHALEYSFGWAPLVGDLVSAVATLGKGIPPPQVSARRSLTLQYSFSTDGTGVYAIRRFRGTETLGWELRAQVRVTNPNTFLANQLGLLNPAAVVWEIIPWSFVIDYFVNVSDFINSFTDRVGIELELASNTFKRVNYWERIDSLKSGYNIPGYQPYGRGDRYVQVIRSVGIPMPSLSLRPPWRMSMQRATTSIALLLQQLRK